MRNNDRRRKKKAEGGNKKKAKLYYKDAAQSHKFKIEPSFDAFKKKTRTNAFHSIFFLKIKESSVNETFYFQTALALVALALYRASHSSSTEQHPPKSIHSTSSGKKKSFEQNTIRVCAKHKDPHPHPLPSRQFNLKSSI